MWVSRERNFCGATVWNLNLKHIVRDLLCLGLRRYDIHVTLREKVYLSS